MSEHGEKRSTRTGRKKIKIEKIEDGKNRQVTFNKRKVGLMKKAIELAVLCDCKVSLMVFHGDKLFQYSSDPMEELIEDFYEYDGSYELLDNSDLHNLRPGKASSIRIGRKKKMHNPFGDMRINQETIPQHPLPRYHVPVLSPNPSNLQTEHESSFKKTRLNNAFALYKGGNSFGAVESHPTSPDTGTHQLGLPQHEILHRNVSFGTQPPYYSTSSGFDRWSGDRQIPFVNTPLGMYQDTGFPHHPRPRHAYAQGSGDLQSSLISHERQDSFGVSGGQFPHSNDISIGFLMHDITSGRSQYDFQHDGIILAPVSHDPSHEDTFHNDPSVHLEHSERPESKEFREFTDMPITRDGSAFTSIDHDKVTEPASLISA